MKRLPLGIASKEAFKRYNCIADEILAWYDGYSWDGVTRLLNPYSLLNFFTDRVFDGYWYETGTPWFLIEMIKAKPKCGVMAKIDAVMTGLALFRKRGWRAENVTCHYDTA